MHIIEKANFIFLFQERIGLQPPLLIRKAKPRESAINLEKVLISPSGLLYGGFLKTRLPVGDEVVRGDFNSLSE